MTPSEDPSDRLLDSLLSEQARGKPDQALLSAVSSKLESSASDQSGARSFKYIWHAAAVAVLTLAAAGLFWNDGNESAVVIDDRELAVRDPSVKPAEDGGEPLSSDRDVRIPGMEDTKPVADYGSTTEAVDSDHLLNSLRFVEEEHTSWYVQFGYESDGKWAPKLVGVSSTGQRFGNRTSGEGLLLEPGDIFFNDLSMAGRFKFIGFSERDVTSEMTKITQTVKIALFEDLKPNKAGVRYESQQPLPRARIDASAYHDRTAVLELAIPGFDGMEFKVEERTWFSLPPGAGENRCFLAEVLPDRIVVEMEKKDGTKEARVIAKNPDFGGGVLPRQRVLPPSPVQGSRENRAGDPGARDEAGEVIPAGEGFLARGLLWKGAKPLPQVYAHDPNARGNPPGVKLEITEGLAPRHQALPIAGKTVVFTTTPDARSVEDPSLVIARKKLPEEYGSCLFVFLPGSGRPGEEPFRVLLVDDSVRAFFPGAALVVNLSPTEVKLKLEAQIRAIKPGEREVILNVPVDANNQTRVSGAQNIGVEWRHFYESVWPPLGLDRMVVFVAMDPAGKLEVQSFRDANPGKR